MGDDTGDIFDIIRAAANPAPPPKRQRTAGSVAAPAANADDKGGADESDSDVFTKALAGIMAEASDSDVEVCPAMRGDRARATATDIDLGLDNAERVVSPNESQSDADEPVVRAPPPDSFDAFIATLGVEDTLFAAPP